jgi:hypothetical protein
MFRQQPSQVDIHDAGRREQVWQSLDDYAEPDAWKARQPTKPPKDQEPVIRENPIRLPSPVELPTSSKILSLVPVCMGSNIRPFFRESL